MCDRGALIWIGQEHKDEEARKTAEKLGIERGEEDEDEDEAEDGDQAAMDALGAAPAEEPKDDLLDFGGDEPAAAAATGPPVGVTREEVRACSMRPVCGVCSRDRTVVA